MMKRLAVFVALACLGLALPGKAQTWTNPTAPVLTGSTLSSGSSYYLYNVGAEMFFVNGNNYLTEASLGDEGFVVKLVNTEGTGDASGWSLNVTSSYDTRWSGTLSNTYIYCAGEYFYVDGSSDTYSSSAAMYYDIDAVECQTNVYTIKSHATNMTYLGWDGTESTVVMGNLTDVSENTEWLLVTADDYTAYQNYKNSDRTFLNNALTDASKIDNIDLSDAIDVYENAASSQTEIDDATRTLAQSIAPYQTADVDSETEITVNGKTYKPKSINLIPNPSFEYGYVCWTRANDFSTEISSSGFSLISEGAQDGTYSLEGTVNGGTNGENSLGTAWSIEAGKAYMFSYYFKSLTGTDTEFLKVSLTNTKGTETDVISTPSSYSTTSWTQVSTVFENPEGNDAYQYCQVHFRWLNSQWLFDDFQLVELERVYTLDDVKEAAAEVTIPTTNIGTGVFQYDQEKLDDLSTAVATAEATEEGLTSEDYYEAIQTLQAAVIKDTKLNEPEDGQVFNIIMADENASASGKGNWYNNAVTFWPGNDTMGGLAFSFAYPANHNRASQLFTFTPATDEQMEAAGVSVNGYIISCVDSIDGTTHYLCTGEAYSGGNASQIRSTTTANDAYVFQVKATDTENVWNIYNTSASCNVGTQGDKGFFTSETHHALTLASANDITWTMTDAGYGTLMLPFVPADGELDGLTLYTTGAYETDEETQEATSALQLVEASTFAANTPYIVTGTAAKEYTFTGTSTAFETSYKTDGNWLTGVYVDTTVATGDGNYVLQNQDDYGVAFYSVSDEAVTLTPNHCYLTPEETTQVTAFTLKFPDGISTGINAAQVSEADSEAIYDLSGRKVSQPQHGIYIKGGKKVVIK